jgi:CO/xanthine dehydrogenase Mo-binding subunit
VDTALSPAAVGTLASRATTIGGMAVVRAAEAAKARLGGFLAGEWGCAPDDVTWEGGVARGPGDRAIGFADAATRWVDANCGLPLLAEGVYRPPTEVPDEEKYGNPSAAYPFCTHVAEVEVDTASGHVTVTRYWAVHDSGRIINPATARSQVVGAVAQGVGWATMEDVVLVDGTVRNANLLDYRMPAAGDMPETVVEFVDGYEPNGPLGAKSLAEAAINPVTAAIANAVHDATGVRVHDLPLTPERVWRLLHGQPVTVELGS